VDALDDHVRSEGAALVAAQDLAAEVGIPHPCGEGIGHGSLNLARRDAPAMGAVVDAALDEIAADVVAIAAAILLCMRRPHLLATRIEELTRQPTWRLRPDLQSSVTPIVSELVLDRLPEAFVEDRRMLA